MGRTVKVSDMELVHPRCAGLDVSKKDAKVCVRISGGGARATQEITTWSSMSADVLALGDYLLAQQVTCVVIESTSEYWKPFFYVLEDCPFQVMLVNAAHAKNVPGRKTDVSDAAWLAQLAAHGLLRASFVPPPPVRELRDLTRARTTLVRDRTRVVQRLEKVLEGSGVKLSVVASDITGVSARAMLQALVDGERDPVVLADLALRRLRAKIPDLELALVGRFTEHHAFMVSRYLRQLDELDALVAEYTARIEEVIEPFRARRDLLTTIPGIAQTTADVIIAETGGDMAQFPTPGQLASWAGVAPAPVRRPVQGRNDPPGQPPSQGRPRHRRPVDRPPEEEDVPVRQVLAPGPHERQAQGHRRPRTHPADHHLGHAAHRSPLRGPRPRLLPAPRPRPRPTPRHGRPQSPRLRRHPHTHRSRLTSTLTKTSTQNGTSVRDGGRLLVLRLLQGGPSRVSPTPAAA